MLHGGPGQVFVPVSKDPIADFATVIDSVPDRS
jgi:hypothetical protein